MFPSVRLDVFQKRPFKSDTYINPCRITQYSCTSAAFKIAIVKIQSRTPEAIQSDYLLKAIQFVPECYRMYRMQVLTHCGRVRQICVFNTVKIGTSASSP